MASAASASTSNTLPMRVTRTAAARGFSGLQLLQEQEAGVVMRWCDLPSDLFGHILPRLPSCRDRVHLSAVCRHWRACARRHSPRLPVRVTRTARGTHVVHVRGFSRLHEQQFARGGFVESPAFAVAGLHWAIRIRSYYPAAGCSDGDGEHGHLGVFVMLLTEGVVARAYVGLLRLDQTTGLSDTVIWDHHPTRFDAAASAYRCDMMGTGGIKGTGFVRGDCLKIECVLEVCSTAACRRRDRRLK
ncbi:hypothetical protein BDA96_07G028900 [Sorghum bicolor]|nr:hypothetical protein BDA96_07G028900 [Sorghum bicolor]